MSHDPDLERLRKQLRKRLEGTAAETSLATTDLRRILDELGRLQQSNDRLRRQNRRLRLKLQRAGLDDLEPAEPPTDRAAPAADDTDA